MVNSTISTLPLSEQLIEHAEWWYCDGTDAKQVSDVSVHMAIVFGSCIGVDRMEYTDEQESYLCLFESEYQKDIENNTP